MQLHMYQGWEEYIYPIQGIQFLIDENGEPVDICIKASDETFDAIERDFNITNTLTFDGERVIFVGRLPKFELK